MTHFSLHSLTLAGSFAKLLQTPQNRTEKQLILAKVMICYGLNENLQNDAFREKKGSLFNTSSSAEPSQRGMLKEQ